jgi:hypothetical protein
MKNGTAHVIGRASDEVHCCSIFSISWTAIDRVENGRSSKDRVKVKHICHQGFHHNRFYKKFTKGSMNSK